MLELAFGERACRYEAHDQQARVVIAPVCADLVAVENHRGVRRHGPHGVILAKGS